MTVLPMFPLGSALLPGSPLPLQIFEPRYLAMLRDIASGDGRFGVVLIERGVEVGGGDQRFAIGTVAGVEQVSPTADGRVRLLARGQERFEVVRWLADDPYPRAEVELLPVLEWSDERTPDLAGTEHTVRRALTVMSEYRTHLWPADVELSDDPVTRSWQLAGIAPLGELDQLALLRSASVSELLESTARLTTEALDLLPMQFPDDPA
ncbi:LON peptidase substrate-binding domain-containing protein [Janibacter limosus]|uniref:Peptidase S16 n=1 Tax=Janibacter limosus TaxID=53458 RepID=A0A4P6MRH7_9MICO|nr:LON peptidase substrate-binding domain-containing protein [Janibacter limosus]QBF46251.1 peptidase S16 [Janibacter limosus]